MASLALASKKVSRPDQPDSPIIHAGQEIASSKSGGCFGRFAWHEWSPRTPVKLNPKARQSFSYQPKRIFQKKNSFQATSRREMLIRTILIRHCFWGRCPGCNPPSVLSSICLIGEPAPPAEDHRRLLPLSHRRGDSFHPQSQPSSTFPGRGRIIVIRDRQGLVSAPPHRLSPGTSYDHNGLRHVGGVSSRPPSMVL